MIRHTAQKWSFSLRISSVNVTNPQFPVDLVTFTEEILNGKFHILFSVSLSRYFGIDYKTNLIINLVSLDGKAKKSNLFPEIGQVKSFLSPTRPHKSNVYENIYFLFQKPHPQTKRFPLANLFVRIYVFSLQTIKDRVLCFSTKKSAVRVVFKV